MANSFKLNKALRKLKSLNNHNPQVVWYSEAKFLYGLLPELIAFLETAKELGLGNLESEDDRVKWESFSELVDKIVKEKIDE